MKQKVLSLIVAGLLMVGITGCRSSGSGNKKQTAEGIATQNTEAAPEMTATTGAETEATTTAEEKPKMSFENTDTNFNYYTNSIGRVEFYGIVEITNTGSTNIYLKDCAFDIEDNDGHLLQSASLISKCPDIIAPGEKGYFYNGIGANLLDKEVSIDNGLKLVPHYKLEEARGESVDYEISDIALRKDDYGNAKITGRITNNTDKDDSLYYINALFKDSSGKVLFITGTNIMDLTAGSTVSFEITAMYADNSIDFDSIADYEIVARADYRQY